MILACLWLSIASSLIYRKVRTEKLELIEAAFARITAAYLYPLPGEQYDLVQTNRTFRELGVVESNPANVQYLQDLMVRTQASLLGENGNKLKLYYKQIPPYRASLQKLNSKKWYVKARGIREIYEMNQEQYISQIFKERNHKNIYVRREAQIGLVVFLGWESLRFLPFLEWEMTLWQQIKIVEKLHDFYPEPHLPRLRKTYRSEKKYAHELIMRIIRKFRLEEEVDYIIRFIDDENHNTRESALYCISSFKLNERRLEEIKKKFFRIPDTEQKKHLLKYISSISIDNDLEFYKYLLNNESDVIQLSSAEILWNAGYISEVEDFYYRQYTDKSEKEIPLLHDS